MSDNRPLSIPVILGTSRSTILTTTDVDVGSVGTDFDEAGNLLDDAFIRRTGKFLGELIWMAKTLRYGGENIGLN